MLAQVGVNLCSHLIRPGLNLENLSDTSDIWYLEGRERRKGERREEHWSDHVTVECTIIGEQIEPCHTG